MEKTTSKRFDWTSDEFKKLIFADKKLNNLTGIRPVIHPMEDHVQICIEKKIPSGEIVKVLKRELEKSEDISGFEVSDLECKDDGSVVLLMKEKIKKSQK